MFLSVFEMFKVGIGPSSSHTMGPMVAAARFMAALADQNITPVRLHVRLLGSLAFTGKGHATDRACILGLAGFSPQTFDPIRANTVFDAICTDHVLPDTGIAFDPSVDLIFDYDTPSNGHANAMEIKAVGASGARLLCETYYSIGGGFVLTADEFEQAQSQDMSARSDVPYPFQSSLEMLDMAQSAGLSIAQMKRANEVSRMSAADLDRGIAQIWSTMDACLERGLAGDGILPGGLAVKRRARGIYVNLRELQHSNLAPPHIVNDWISAYAMAVNEENAAGGQVVTAPTNGAAGVIPACIRYWLDHVPQADPAQLPDFLLTAAAIGGLIKHNASISGAECGCQAEVGSASAMAAAGMCAVLGGTPAQVENAAEIALEHHLGMTCDPVAGLVQVPCIERNGLGAIKAVAAASLALHGDGSHLVPLDSAIATLWQTGRDMSDKYKETSLGGLAVNIPNC
ncbi:L-serine ammonia-lyase [Celeribacter marinus]|uniref:L-serine dehydratase n=1 Tax=Celeribacter marinus TaxID=1397108 RepID=A0A0N7HIX7_9RHOB|nr:L-serine ammonia-lyase [Celeribacter marinus]ALI56453.1 L-serine dehydratase, beta subunit / L-serine dehydratase, alpha subunit [Celeribacter marinus]SFK42764.1 L-serine ammonia-lyase [Celeribacter marinus]